LELQKNKIDETEVAFGFLRFLIAARRTNHAEYSAGFAGTAGVQPHGLP